MDERNHNSPEPWDRDSFRTGSTKPPKSRGGLIAVLLICVILLCSISGALGILNIRLFSRLQQEKEGSLSFYDGTNSTSPLPSNTAEDPKTTEPHSVTKPTGDAALDLKPAPEGMENIPQYEGLSLQQIYEQAIDSVVSITCTLENGGSSGTGVVLSKNGYIVTNCHVVEGATAIEALFTDGRELSAWIIGADAVSDLAVLWVDAEDLTPAQFGDSSTLRVGDVAVAIGDPLGVELRGTMTDGIVSAINRNVITGGRTMTLIQTNAALNSGNSGGPLINCYGQVIGINTMKIGAFTDSAGVEGLGFAIPSTLVKEVVDQLIHQGYVSGRPTLGIEGETLSSFYQHYYRLPAGLYVTKVDPGTDAYRKGIDNGDILLSLNDTRIYSMDDLKTFLYNSEVGQTVEAVVYRGGQQYLLELTLSEDKG